MSFFFFTPGVAKVVDLESFWHFPQTILCVGDWDVKLMLMLLDGGTYVYIDNGFSVI